MVLHHPIVDTNGKFNILYQILPCTAGGASGLVVYFRGMRSKSWNVLSIVVLKIRTSKLCVVPFLMTFHTRIFGVYQEIDSYSFFFARDIFQISELRSRLEVFFTMSPKRLVNLVPSSSQDPDRTKFSYGISTTGRKCAFGAMSSGN